MFPILLKLGPFTIHTYGLMMAFAFLIGIYISRREALRKGIDQNCVFDFVFYVLIFGLLGARLYYAIFYDIDILFKNPLKFFALWQGGLSIQGGITTGILVAVWFCRKHKVSFWKFTDTIAPSVFLGEAIGRLGCFSAGCCYGKVSHLPWSVTFHHPKSLAPIGVPLHPTQLYTFLANIVGFVFIWSIRKKIKNDGYIFILYLLLSSINRFVIEFFRGDCVYIIGGILSVAQIYSIFAIIISVFLFLSLSKFKQF